MRAVAYIFPDPTSGVRGPDTLWRVPWTPLFAVFFCLFDFPKEGFAAAAAERVLPLAMSRPGFLGHTLDIINRPRAVFNGGLDLATRQLGAVADGYVRARVLIP